MYLPATACVRLVSWSLVRFWPAMTSWQELGEPLGRAEYRDASLELIKPSRACSPRLVLLLASVSSVWTWVRVWPNKQCKIKLDFKVEICNNN